MHSPIQYLSFWIFAIALLVLIITVFYGINKGSFDGTQYWIIVISGLVALFGLWLLILNYSNDAVYHHVMKMHPGAAENEMAGSLRSTRMSSEL